MARIKTEAKIKKYPIAPAALNALSALLNEYRTGRKVAGSTCVLCNLVGRTSSHVVSKAGKCKECPWVQITGDVCSAKRYTNASRIAELPGWISLYELSVKQNYAVAAPVAPAPVIKPVVPVVKTIADAIQHCKYAGYDVSLAVKELTALKDNATKLANARYYANCAVEYAKSVVDKLK